MKILLTVLLCSVLLQADLTHVMSEPNLEKRSKAALDHAEDTLKESRHAYTAGDLKQTGEYLDEFEKSVDLAESSLKESGKIPHKSPKYFKYAEIKTGVLLRRLEAFAQEMNLADRSLVEKVKEKVQGVHDRFLLGIMGKKK